MPYQTDERLKSYLDTNQLHREQLCRAILAIDKRFSDVRPRHPRGGPDGGRDIEALFRDESLAYGAVGFVNQANDSKDQKRSINEKFSSDLDSALGANKKPSVFVFFTNINLTIGEKDSLIDSAKKQGITHCEILDRERLRITLDSPDGFSLRFQYLNITLSEEEQASFFARWGDDIQSVISTGFQRIEGTLNRLLFLQESTDPLNHLTLSFELKEKYSADDIGHFRLFCSMYLKEPKQKIFGIIFGSSDKSNRMRSDMGSDFTEQLSGIKHGIAGGQWESYLDIENDSETEIDDEEDERYKQVGSSSSIGRSEVEFLPMYINQPLFSEVEIFLRGKGFVFHRFAPLTSRIVSPMIIDDDIYRGLSQMFWADAVFIRDFTKLSRLPPEKLLKFSIILHDIYESYDLVLRILMAHDDQTATNYAELYLKELESMANE